MITEPIKKLEEQIEALKKEKVSLQEENEKLKISLQEKKANEMIFKQKNEELKRLTLENAELKEKMKKKEGI